MIVEPTAIAGCLLVRTKVLEDERGFFLESYKQSAITRTLGRPHRFGQGNHSRSKAGVLRGFHAEPWDKLISVVHGRALIVVADPRPESPTFGAHVMFELGDAPGTRDRVFVANGLGNAFYCFTEVDYWNDVSDEFDPANRGGFAWNDPFLGIDWPTEAPILSPKDQGLTGLSDQHADHPAVRRWREGA
ncbi:dTDP-4-dehydrorhamnose 3,5-epimerase family protein [Acuticoccus sp. I52.16.1]|uniref:dTDP-4-dehydrorhamnose 3,5-epimerase family protein n=1 Tax=Acuticoccus sp. I52.16.1 TaxID=2928472 RepID=UPI001FD15D76|nr:dTDP-4-dehydrorhamnose 3,5-epimerase family protein [Acuticoccus sp. I52.16.1]UOM34277.1 dTDP-4-dehydrorhamnose 3,5-epimerase family protein [Acuticoccus sp. I52.16.1]